jgi:hypothetical protein
MTARRTAPCLAVCLALLLAASEVWAHAERQIESPIRPGPVPALNRRNARVLVVCKPSSKPTKAEHRDIHTRLRTTTGDALAQAQAQETAWHRNSKLFRKCRFEHIQEAVEVAGNDTDILVLPGVYREEPSRAKPTSMTGDNPDGSYSYEYHVANPNDANLIAILGKEGITLEGTGIEPEDVLIDTGFAKDIGVRCDRCTGFIVRNLWQRDANEHGIYVVDSDGYIFDRTRGSYNKEYSLFSFASDNGLYTDCEAEGGGDSGLYIGGAPDTHLEGRFSAEVRRCKIHHNPLGFSGTQGSSVWMHDNDFYDNAIGISYDSENDHPNFPQRWSVIENNLIHDNNFDVYAATSDVPVRGPGYDFFRYPVGTGMWIIGGEDNVIRNNIVWNNSRFGFILARNPEEVPLPSVVHRNQYVGNVMGTDPDGNPAPNATAFPATTCVPATSCYGRGGSDFFWDETGDDNCWGPHDPASGPVKTDPPVIPGPCPAPNVGGAQPLAKLLLLANCILDDSDPPHTTDATYPCPWGQTNDAPYQNGNEQECGNGIVDLGEDCDGGYGGGGGGFVPSETCESLGHGPGTLACSALCIWDTSACAADNCSEYGASRTRYRRAAGDADLRAFDLQSAGLSFDPRVEEVSIVFRDDEGLLHNAVIPASSPGWSAGASSFTYLDPAGTFGRVTRIQLSATPSFSSDFRALVQVRGADVSGAASTRTSTTVLRIGDDCWSDTTPCTLGAQNTTCKGRPQP